MPHILHWDVFQFSNNSYLLKKKSSYKEGFYKNSLNFDGLACFCDYFSSCAVAASAGTFAISVGRSVFFSSNTGLSIASIAACCSAVTCAESELTDDASASDAGACSGLEHAVNAKDIANNAASAICFFT